MFQSLSKLNKFIIIIIIIIISLDQVSFGRLKFIFQFKRLTSTKFTAYYLHLHKCNPMCTYVTLNAHTIYYIYFPNFFCDKFGEKSDKIYAHSSKPFQASRSLYKLREWLLNTMYYGNVN